MHDMGEDQLRLCYAEFRKHCVERHDLRGNRRTRVPQPRELDPDVLQGLEHMDRLNDFRIKILCKGRPAGGRACPV